MTINTCDETDVNDAIKRLFLKYCIFKTKNYTANAPLVENKQSVQSKAILHTMDRLVCLL